MHFGLVIAVLPSLPQIMKNPTPIWRSVKEELSSYSEGMMVFAVGSWVAPWCPMFCVRFLSRWVLSARVNVGRVRCA